MGAPKGDAWRALFRKSLLFGVSDIVERVAGLAGRDELTEEK